jgi:hypothetical protein
MRCLTKKLCGSLFALGLAALWTTAARAQCTTTCTNTPATYIGGNAGDVAVMTVPPNPTIFQSALQQMISPLAEDPGNPYIHTKLLYDGSGSNFTETFPTDVSLVPSHTTGEPHSCSRPISPYFLQRLAPGAGIYQEDAEPGILVRGMGYPYCNVPADGYHLNSFLNDDIPGGSCEKLLVDYCGVPVDPVQDRTVFNEGNAIASLNAAWNIGYGYCMDIIGGTEAEVLAFIGIQGLGCGGTPEYVSCERAGWQLVNEMLFKAYPTQYVTDPGFFEVGPPAPNGEWYMDGWSDFNPGGPPPNPSGPFPPPNADAWWGTMLGAGKANYQTEPDGTICPGACDDGGCNNPPLGCEPWAPTAWTANLPQNILNAAGRLGYEMDTVVLGSGIAQSSTTCTTTCQEDYYAPDPGGGPLMTEGD